MSKFEKELENKVGPHDRTFNGHKLFLGGFLAEHFKDWQPQQALPVVPEHVGDYISELKEKGHGIQFGLMCSTHNVAGEGNEKAINWKDDNAEDFARAWLDGYTVEKPQLFYLRAKELLVVGDYDHVEDLWLDCNKNFTPKKQDAHKFTQEEIDSMQTGNYEQIEVEP